MQIVIFLAILCLVQTSYSIYTPDDGEVIYARSIAWRRIGELNGDDLKSLGFVSLSEEEGFRDPPYLSQSFLTTSRYGKKTATETEEVDMISEQEATLVAKQPNQAIIGLNQAQALPSSKNSKTAVRYDNIYAVLNDLDKTLAEEEEDYEEESA